MGLCSLLACIGQMEVGCLGSNRVVFTRKGQAMLTSRVFNRTVLFCATAWLLVGMLQAAEAEKSITVEKAKVPPPPAAAPAAPVPAPAAPAPAAPAPAAAPAPTVEATCCAPAPKCCCPKDRCIRYWDHKLSHKCHRDCCKCEPPTKLILQVKDPCCCECVVEVPVCAPACLEGEPKVESCCGPLGRGVVTYAWCSGFKVKVVFHLDADLTVHTFGM
jgi:hypothetical protein